MIQANQFKVPRHSKESWYMVFDGTSYYAVLGMDLEDLDDDCELVSRNTYKQYPEEAIENLNKQL